MVVEENCNISSSPSPSSLNNTTNHSGTSLINLGDDDDESTSSNISSISSSPSTSSLTKKPKKPRKNKPTNLILGNNSGSSGGNITTNSGTSCDQPDTTIITTTTTTSTITTDQTKIADDDERYTDEAVKINDGTFRFGDQIVIGQDGIQQSTTTTIPKLQTPSSSSSEITMTDFSAGTSPSNYSSSSMSCFVNNNSNEHILYEDLEEVCKLGRGASSTVYKVIHKKTKQVYAMKKINVDLNDQKPKLIVSEFKSLYNNDCPYVMTLYDAYYRQGCILMVLKFMDCGSLEDVLNTSGRIPECILSRICEQLLKGLEYLHTVKKIVHRDIKPANVLVHNTGEVCIADFGMAGLERSQKYLQNLQQTCKFETYCGTHAYMSVERIRGQPHSYDSDIWSFGLTVAEAFLGVFPFVLSANASIWDMLNFMEKSTDAPFPLEDASEEFKDFIYSTLRINRKQRPTATCLLQHPFITKYRHKKPQFLEKWIYYSFIAPRQLAKMNISIY